LTASWRQYSREQIKHSILGLAGSVYIILGKDLKWIFSRSIETLAFEEEETNIQFLAYSSVLIARRIKNTETVRHNIGRVPVKIYLPNEPFLRR
jgi:hypothetical protein